METEPENELLEVIAADGQTLGLRLRREIHGDPSLRHRAVHVVVHNGGGDVFLQKRSLCKRIQPGKWDTSVGGHVDPGESYEQAAARELQEELGVSATVLEHAHDYVWQTSVETEHVRTFVLTHEGPFTLHPDEIDEGRFFTVEELRSQIPSGAFTPNLVHELGLLGLI